MIYQPTNQPTNQYLNKLLILFAIIFTSTVVFSKQTSAAQKRNHETITVECDPSCMQRAAEARTRAQAYEINSKRIGNGT